MRTTGTVERRGEGFRAGIPIASKERAWITLPTCKSPEAAAARKELLAELAASLRGAGIDKGIIKQLLERAGARDGAELEAVRQAVASLCAGPRRKVGQGPAGNTFETVGKRWTSGELARDYPDHVKTKRSSERDVQRLKRYVYPLIGRKPVDQVTLDDAEAVMRALPPAKVRTPATRRHVAQLLHRVLALAVFPLRLMPVHPLPPGFMPKLGRGKAKGWLYPDEDGELLSAVDAVPFPWRLFYGFLHREGPRAGEAAALDLADVDLRRGVLTLDANKTDDPRAWALSAGVVRALRRALELRGSTLPTAPLFVDEQGERLDPAFGAERFRTHLEAAGVDRPELFERSSARLWIRLHDTRATFVTLALANGRTETWVADRTGHRSSEMINKYRRAARTAAELDLGDLAPLDRAIPELRPAEGESEPGPESQTESQAGDGIAKTSGSGAGIRTPIRGFKVSAGCAQASDQQRSSGFSGGADDGSGANEHTRDAKKVGRDSAGGPRAALVRQLLAGLGAAIEAGDLGAARVAHGAIGQLLGIDDADAVVDLDEERKRRLSRKGA